MPVKLLAIRSEDLEHTDDKFLDAEYEQRLISTGDNLLPINFDEEQISALFGSVQNSGSEPAAPFSPEQASKNNKAVAIAVDLGKEEDYSLEIPVLPEDPTQDELLQYAENHPNVKRILRLFRGTITNVNKK